MSNTIRILLISLIIVLWNMAFTDVERVLGQQKVNTDKYSSGESIKNSASQMKFCPPGFVIDKSGYCDSETKSVVPSLNSSIVLTNGTSVGDSAKNVSSSEKPITGSTEFDAILSAANGVPPVNSSASASAHFQLKNDAKELTVPSFSLDRREILGIIAVHIHAGNNTENGPIVLTLRDYNGSGVDAWEEQLISSGPIIPEEFEGPLRGKTIADLIDLINEGTAYVDIHTTFWSIPELRGTISPTINETMSAFTDRQNIDLRKLGYDDGCSDARDGILSSSLGEQSNTYRLGYKE